MKKHRKYLHNLVSVNINRLVNHDGSFELQMGLHTLSLVPETYGKRCFLAVFINNQRQQMQWDLYERPHVGRLRNGAVIGHRFDSVYYVIGGDGRRYRHLFLCPETCRLGVRTDFFPNHRAYPRGKAREASKTFKERCRAMERELFGEKDEFMAEYRKREKLSRFGN